MAILFVRSIIIYILVFVVIRLTGKRQISELQPFDLVITLLIADLAAVPVSDTTLPLTYGIVPIIALFLIQKVISFFALKSANFRKMLCGKPLVIISAGRINESVMREASYTLRDLMEQLRGKDIFRLSDVAYAILETNGDLSVLLSGQAQTPTYADMNITPPPARPGVMLILDGKPTEQAAGMERELKDVLRKNGCLSAAEVLFAVLDADNVLSAQTKEKYGTRTFTAKLNVEVNV